MFAFERDFELYVDIVTPPTFAETTITMVDLDLDVVRWPDGRAELIDEDEFDEHQIRYGYPQDVIDHAVATAAEVLEAVTRRAPPFGAPPQFVLDAFRDRPLQRGQPRAPAPMVEKSDDVDDVLERPSRTATSA